MNAVPDDPRPDEARDRQMHPPPLRSPGGRLRRLVFFAVVAASATYGIRLMLDIVSVDGVTLLEIGILLLFGITFAWIAVSFWTAVAGFLLQLLRLDPLSLTRRRRLPRYSDRDLTLTTRTAVVMPVYNEESHRVLAGLAATYQSLQRTGHGDAFDFYLLSDTTDPECAERERETWSRLCARLRGGSGLYYRRRPRNVGRKAGNVAEFCRRWGGHYDHMIVLDADSVMTGETLLEMTAAMQANPAAGIIQTVPVPVRQRSLFGRFIQFASGLYSPMLSAGLSFWQTDISNYWGHNAILRVRAFTEHCGLPDLPGKPPLGGEILSHDIVEAALMKRAGWQVFLLADLEGSYEEVPSNVLDYARRDRRWAEGNLQHLRLLGAHGMHPLSRLHFLLGAFAYLCSFFWMLMLILGTADAAGRALTVHDFFYSGAQLFPHWPIAKVEEILLLLGLVIGMLIAPKVLGVVLCLIDPERRRRFGGALRVIAGALVELVLSILLAPVMMSFHAWFVACVLCGRRVVWNPQSRDGRRVTFGEALRSTWLISLAGLAWGIGTWWITPIFFWALTPVLVGMVLAAPLIVGSSWMGRKNQPAASGIFVTEHELQPLPVLQRVDWWIAELARERAGEVSLLEPVLPAERPRTMPMQRLDAGPRWNARRTWAT